VDLNFLKDKKTQQLIVGAVVLYALVSKGTSSTTKILDSMNKNILPIVVIALIFVVRGNK